MCAKSIEDSSEVSHFELLEAGFLEFFNDESELKKQSIKSWSNKFVKNHF